MLALYTQSVDSALLLAAVKEKYYAGEDADLFYISATTDEVAIIRQLKKADIFCNIYIIDYPSALQPTDGRFGKIPKLRKVMFSWAIYDYFQFFLREYTQGKQYSRLIVPHLGDCVQYIAYFFTKNDPKLEICFYGEGTDPYRNRTGQYLGHWGAKPKSKKDRVMNRVGEKKYLKPLRRYAKPIFYLQMPDRNQVDPWFQELHEIPSLLEFPHIFDLLRKAADELPLHLKTAYSRRRAVFFASAYAENQNNLVKFVGMGRDGDAFQALVLMFGMRGVLMRPVQGLPLNREFLGLNAEQHDGLFVDRLCFHNSLTPLLCTAPDRLILVGNDPGMMAQSKLLFHNEPYLVFTYLVTGKADPGFDAFVSNLRKAYQRPEKIAVPATAEELEEALIACRNDLYDRIYPKCENVAEEGADYDSILCPFKSNIN